MSESTTVLISEEDLQKRIADIGLQIRADIGDSPIVLLCVLKGAFPFLADLCRAIPGEVLVDFVQISSYAGEKSSTGVVQLKKDHEINIEGKHVVVVEDIIDTGLTITHLRELLMTRKPASLRVAAVVNKFEARTHPAQVEYIGFDIPNRFVVGYGLDYKERYRQLPYIAILEGATE